MTTKRYKRWMAAALAAVMTAALSISSGLALPAAEPLSLIHI